MKILIIYLTAIASFWSAMPVLRLSATPKLVGWAKNCPPYTSSLLAKNCPPYITHKQQTTNNKQATGNREQGTGNRELLQYSLTTFPRSTPLARLGETRHLLYLGRPQDRSGSPRSQWLLTTVTRSPNNNLALSEVEGQQTTYNKQKNQPRVELTLTVDRQIKVESETGETEFKWQPLPPEDRVLPGEILRYRLVGKNNGSQPVSSMVLTQPIPSEMTYILNSAKGASNITFSIDNGVTFDANPTITNVNELGINNGQLVEQAAPPENYTHVRWNFERVLDPGEEFVGTFEVRVR